MINNFNKQGSYQFCELQGHNLEKIIGFCLKTNCYKQSFYCQKCLKKQHSSHFSDCKTFQEIQQILENKIESFQYSLNKLNDVEQVLKQQIEFLYQEVKKQTQILLELSQFFSNIDYDQMFEQVEQIKKIYKVEKTILDIQLDGYLQNFKQFSQKFDSDKQNYLQDLAQKQKQKVTIISDEESDDSSDSNTQQEINRENAIQLLKIKEFEVNEQNIDSKQQNTYIIDEQESTNNNKSQNENKNQQITNSEQNQQTKTIKNIKMIENHLQILEQSNILFNEAQNLSIQGLYNEAIQKYDEIYNLGMFKVRALIEKGIILRNQFNYDQALVCLDEATQLDPNNIQAHLSKGNALFMTGQYEKSIKCYDIILLKNLKTANVFSNRAACLKQLNRIDEAIADCKISVELDQYDSFSQKLLGELLFVKGEFNQCIQYFENAYQFNPLSSEPIKYKCLALIQLKKYDEALSICDTIINKNQSNQWVYKIKSKIFQCQQLFYDALDCCEIGLVLNPFDFELKQDKEKLQKILNDFKNII